MKVDRAINRIRRRWRYGAEQEHYPTCPEFIARTCEVPIECGHGFDCCPVCDPCKCAEIAAAAERNAVTI